MTMQYRFLVTYFDAGAPKYEAGKCYPADAETTRLAMRGDAVEVEGDSEQAPVDGQQDAVVDEMDQPAAEGGESTPRRRGRPPKNAA